MNYITYFEVPEIGIGTFYSLSPILIFMLLFIGIGILTYKNPSVISSSPNNVVRGISIMIIGLVSLIFLFLIAGTYIQNKELRDALENGEYKVVEGKIKNFIPYVSSEHKRESFIISGVKFEYSHNVLTAAFNQTSSNGGPIHNGLPVRISYLKDSILKLEIAKDYK